MTGEKIIDLRPFPPELLEGLAWFVFWIALAVVIVFSVILLFHWKRYGLNARMFFVAETVYVVGSAAFVGLAAVSIQAF